MSGVVVGIGVAGSLAYAGYSVYANERGRRETERYHNQQSEAHAQLMEQKRQELAAQRAENDRVFQSLSSYRNNQLEEAKKRNDLIQNEINTSRAKIEQVNKMNAPVVKSQQQIDQEIAAGLIRGRQEEMIEKREKPIEGVNSTMLVTSKKADKKINLIGGNFKKRKY